MPEPQAHPELPRVKRVARHAIILGVALMLTKFVVFWLTNSAAVLTDALESIINIAAACMVLWTVTFASRPADRDHPYGHGKAEFMAVGLEGWLILLAGIFIAFEAVRRLIYRATPTIETWHIWMLAAVGVCTFALAMYVYRAGKRYDSAVLVADGKHLLTDFASTAGVLAGVFVVHLTGWHWLDPIVALVMAALILFASWRLLWQSIDGLMDRTDPADDATIHQILDEELSQGHIRGYHKVRHRHTGAFHWVDMHLQMDAALSVRKSHDIASAIERRIELSLGQANATAHIEPYDDASPTQVIEHAEVAQPGAALEKPGTDDADTIELDDTPRLSNDR